MTIETATMAVGEFLIKVFEDQPKEACLRLEGGILIDWTSREYWGAMSNQHWIEILVGGKSVFALSFGQDCLCDEDKGKILAALQQHLSIESQDMASVQGHVEETAQ
jgi:hypothetical protein